MSWTVLKNPLLSRSFTIRCKPEKQDEKEIVLTLHGGVIIDVMTDSFARKACETLEEAFQGGGIV